MDYLDLRQKDLTYVEAIKDGEIIKVPENVAIIEDLFILRKISNSVTPPVQIQNNSKINETVRNSSIMYDWKHGKFGGKKNNVLADLIPNFQWEISRNRKLKNMSRFKLAQLINSNEENVKMIELGELPSDDFVLISRIEQVFGINLRKHPNSIAQVDLADLQKRGEERKDRKTDVFSESKNFFGEGIEVIDD